MKKTIAFVANILLATSFATSVHAESLADIYALAAKNDPRLRSARATFLAGRESRTIGRAALLPQVVASGQYSETDTDSRSADFFNTSGNLQPSGRDGDTDTDTTRYSLTLTQPLFDMAAWFQFRGGDALSEQARSQFSYDQQDLIIRVADAYFNVLRASENLASAQAEQQAIQRQLEQTKQRFDVGLVPITDVHEAQATYDNALVNTLESRGDLAIVFEALEVLTGQPHQQLAGLMETFPIEKPQPEGRDEWVQFAMQNNYLLKASQFAREAAQNRASEKKAEHLPKLSGSINYNSSDSESQFDGVDIDSGGSLKYPSTRDEDTTTFALNLSMPIFTGGLVSAERRRAYQQAVAAEENLVAVRRDTVQQARSEHLNVLTDAARVSARRQAITSADSALQATRAGYEVGTRNIVDVLQAERSLFQARRDYANARYDYIGSMLELKRVAGLLGPDDIYELNAWLDPAIVLQRAN